MAVKYSTGLRAGLAVTGSLRSLLSGGKVQYYAGPVPATADAPLAGNTLLVEITDAVDGCLFEAAAPSGALVKSTSQTWTGTAVADGSVTFFRYVLPSDTGLSTSSEVRIQGALSDMNISSAAIVTGTPYNIDNFALTFPEQ